MEAGGAGGASALGVPGGNEEKSEANQKNETMHRLKQVLRCYSDPGVLVALVVLVSAVGVGLGWGEGVVRWRDVEAGSAGGAGALGVPGGCKQHNVTRRSQNQILKP